MTTTINSGSSALLTVSFQDRNGAPATPTAATYSIACLATGNVVRAVTPFPTLAASVDLSLTSTDTAMQDPTNTSEKKRVIVVSTYPTGEKTTADYYFAIRNVA